MRKRLLEHGWTRNSVVTVFEVKQDGIPLLSDLCKQPPYEKIVGADLVIYGEADPYHAQRSFIFIDGLHRTTGQ
jgi:hypothetical protein